MPQTGKSNKILRKALEGIISVLGPAGEKAIISELSSKCDYQQEFLDLEIVRETLERFFGANSTELLLEQVRKVESRFNTRVAELKTVRNRSEA